MVSQEVTTDSDATTDVDGVRSDLEGVESAVEEKDYESAHDIVQEAIEDLTKVLNYLASKIEPEEEA